MILDWNPHTECFFLRISRSEGIDPHKIVREAGFDFSNSDSKGGEAILFTREPYAAVGFHQYSTPNCRVVLGRLLDAIKDSWAEDSNARIRMPADMELWPFQRAGVAFALRRQNTLFGDQPGLGKTPQAICYANEINARRVLVLCPANIRLQWVRFIRKWSTVPFPYHVYPILEGKHGVHPTAAWTVCSYDLARTPAIGAALAEGLYDTLILDEAHYLKTSDSGRTRAVFGGGESRAFAALASRCGSVIALTGTPLPNRPREAYTLARGLCFDSVDWMSEEKFKQRFNPSMKIEGQRADGSWYVGNREEIGRASELQARLRGNFMVRRLKRQVMPQLDLPYYDLIQVDKTGPVKQALMAESLLQIDPERLEGADMKVMGDLAVVRHQMGLAMAPQVVDYVDMLLDGGEEKLVVYAWHVGVLDILEAGLREYGVARIDGSVSSVQRQKRVDDFRTDPNIRVLIGNMQALGTGTDGLQDVACHCLFAESSWVPGENEQCVDRLDRGGQKRKVQADFFVAPGSISEKVLASALRKRQGTHRALDAQEAFG